MIAQIVIAPAPVNMVLNARNFNETALFIVADICAVVSKTDISPPLSVSKLMCAFGAFFVASAPTVSVVPSSLTAAQCFVCFMCFCFAPAFWAKHAFALQQNT